MPDNMPHLIERAYRAMDALVAALERMDDAKRYALLGHTQWSGWFGDVADQLEALHQRNP